MSYLPSSPGLTNLAGVLAKYPRRGILLFKLLEDIKMSCSPLSKEMRELIITYISGLNRSESCYNVHKIICSELGIDVSVFAQLSTDIDNADVDEKIKPILRYLKKLTLTPGRITEEDAMRIFEAGWDERAFLDCVSICSIVNCINRLVTGLGMNVASSTAHKARHELLGSRCISAGNM